MQDGFFQPIESSIIFFFGIYVLIFTRNSKVFSYPNSSLPHLHTTGKVNFQSSRAILLPIEFLSNLDVNERELLAINFTGYYLKRETLA